MTVLKFSKTCSINCVINCQYCSLIFAALPALLTHRCRSACWQVLDVASASGEPALTIARALPRAQVASTDLAEAFQELGQVGALPSKTIGRQQGALPALALALLKPM